MAHTAIRTCIGALAVGVLAMAASACSDSAVYPATLEELPPKDPPAKTAGPDETSDSEEKAPPQSPSGLEITCAIVDIELPDGWQGRQESGGEWVFGLPSKDTGGGNLRIGGTFTPGAQVKSPSELERMVRGEGGSKVPVQEGADGGVLSRLVVSRGNEWRLAKSFPQKGTQLVRIEYAPAGKASDAKVEETSALLHAAAAKATIADPGGCDE
jgi:hypothetical protein